MPADENGNKVESDLPPAKFLGEYFGTEYFDYVGRVEWREAFAGRTPLGKYLVVADRKTGETLCEISSSHEKEFINYVGKVINFRGKLDHGLVIPHNK